MSAGVVVSVDGHKDRSSESQLGPCHQRVASERSGTVSPRVTRSAGLSAERTYRKVAVESLRSSVIRFSTKIAFREVDFSQSRTHLESVQIVLDEMESLSSWLTNWLARDPRTKPSSSRRGKLTSEGAVEVVRTRSTTDSGTCPAKTADGNDSQCTQSNLHGNAYSCRIHMVLWVTCVFS